MVSIEKRKGKKLFIYPNSKALKYLHSCNGCGADIYLTIGEERIQKGYCKKCSNRHRDIILRDEFDDNGKKICRKCKRGLSKEHFAIRKNNRCHSNCRKCEGLYVFGINASDYLKILEEQNGVCAICKKPETALNNQNRNRTKDLSVDHCHKTGKIRGLLCSKCNIILGNAGDDVDILVTAIKYLKNYK